MRVLRRWVQCVARGFGRARRKRGLALAAMLIAAFTLLNYFRGGAPSLDRVMPPVKDDPTLKWTHGNGIGLDGVLGGGDYLAVSNRCCQRQLFDMNARRFVRMITLRGFSYVESLNYNSNYDRSYNRDGEVVLLWTQSSWLDTAVLERVRKYTGVKWELDDRFITYGINLKSREVHAFLPAARYSYSYGCWTGGEGGLFAWRYWSPDLNESTVLVRDLSSGRQHQIPCSSLITRAVADRSASHMDVDPHCWLPDGRTLVIVEWERGNRSGDDSDWDRVETIWLHTPERKELRRIAVREPLDRWRKEAGGWNEFRSIEITGFPDQANRVRIAGWTRPADPLDDWRLGRLGLWDIDLQTGALSFVMELSGDGGMLLNYMVSPSAESIITASIREPLAERATTGPVELVFRKPGEPARVLPDSVYRFHYQRLILKNEPPGKIFDYPMSAYLGFLDEGSIVNIKRASEIRRFNLATGRLEVLWREQRKH